MRERTPSPLSRAAVVAAGVDLVAEGGMAALSMRRIAERLGVWPTAVYHWVDSREHLAELVVDRIVDQVTVPSEDVEPVEWLRRTAQAMRTVALAHPGTAAYLLEQGGVGPASLRFSERVAARIAALGYAGDELARAYNLYMSWVAGAVHKTDRFLARGGADGLRPFTDALDRVDPAAYPHVAAMRPGVHAMMAGLDESFAWSLDVVLDALATRGRTTREHHGAR